MLSVLSRMCPRVLQPDNIPSRCVLKVDLEKPQVSKVKDSGIWVHLPPLFCLSLPRILISCCCSLQHERIKTNEFLIVRYGRVGGEGMHQDRDPWDW